jgi:hypothetical protein
MDCWPRCSAHDLSVVPALWGALCLAAHCAWCSRDWLLAICGIASLVAISGAPTAVTNRFDVISVLVAAGLIRLCVDNRRRATIGALGRDHLCRGRCRL